MRSSLQPTSSLLVAVAAGLFYGCYSGKSQTAGWTPDSALLAQLAPPIQLRGYELRPPKDWVFFDKSHDDVAFGIWEAPARSDGFAPKFWMISAPTKGKLKPDEAMDDGTKLFGQGWTLSPREYGKVAGIDFVRARFVQSNKGRGVTYFGVIGERFVCITGLDQEPHHEPTLKLLEAAALTFRKP